MKRGKPLARKTPMKPGRKPLKASAPKPKTGDLGSRVSPRPKLRQRSKAKSAEMAERAPLVVALDAAGVLCEIGPLLARAGVTPFRCSRTVQGVHERRKRSSAGSVTIAENLIPACNRCNGWIETDLPVLAADDPERWAEIMALLVVREGDPGWDRLGRRSTGPKLTVHYCRTCREPYAQIAPCGHENRLRDTSRDTP